MLIQPDTYIKLIRNCPLDNHYINTLYFDSKADQTRYFKETLTGINLPKQSYQRYDKGVLTISVKTESLYNCNYLMFQNTAFADKYFYAFITSVEYVNNVTSRVYYEIDVMQTWFFDYTVEDSFIEREHAEYDPPGGNLVPEKLDTGEFRYRRVDLSPYAPFRANDYKVVIAYGTDKTKQLDPSTQQELYQTIRDNLFSGVDFEIYDNPSAAYEKLKYINDELGQSDSVISVFQIPNMLFSALNFDYSTKLTQDTFGNALNDIDLTPFKNDPLSALESGYMPHNMKLFTSPYFGITVTSSSGDTKNFGYEYFKERSVLFKETFALSADPILSMYPVNYKGIENNIEEEIICKDFPQCAYATDSYRAYIAQNAGKITLGIASDTIKTAGAFAVNPAMGIAKGATAIANKLATWRDISMLPDKPRGNSTSAINYTRNTAGFNVYQYKISADFARIIDNYFDMYGYATHLVKKPNRNSRPHWNYVKTMGVNLNGSLPTDDMEKIHNIYDNGITFWKNGNEVGNYSLDNKAPGVAE